MIWEDLAWKLYRESVNIMIDARGYRTGEVYV
jgi:hypothetical protein